MAVATTTIMLSAIIGALIQLDAPYIGVGTSLQPVALDAALTRLREVNPEPASLWEPCERLAQEQVAGGGSSGPQVR